MQGLLLGKRFDMGPGKIDVKENEENAEARY